MAKPIAIIANKLTDAIDIMIQLKTIRQISEVNKKIIDINGQVYYIITEVEQLYGIELSDYIVIPHADENPNFERLLQVARERMI